MKRRKPARGKIETVYDYTDERGKLLYQVVRYYPKDFRFRRPVGPGWSWSLGMVRRVPYRLPELLQAAADRPDEPIFIVEGEKDVESLRSIALTATTNSGGGGRGKWPKAHNRFFRRLHVVILPDNDVTGRAHAQDVADNLKGYAATLRIVELPGLAPKGDVSDWLSLYGTRDKLLALLDEAPGHTWRPEIEFAYGAEHEMEWVYAIAPKIASVLGDDTLSAQEKLLLIIRRLPFRRPKKLTTHVLSMLMRLTERRIKQIVASLRQRGKL
jgi:hypothetical protein